MFKPDVLIAAVFVSILGLITAAFGLRDHELDNLALPSAETDRIQTQQATLPNSTLVNAPEAGLALSDLATKSPGNTTRPQPRSENPSQSAGQPTPSSASSPSSVAKVLPSPTLPAQPPAAPSQSSFQPPQYRADVHPSNFGERYAQDAYGQPASQNWIAVLHETVGSATSAVNHFQTPHPDDADQASYHALIAIDGSIIYLVPPEKRAYGAGNSVFDGPNGIETIKTNPDLPPSVNNFAYHVSLETPPDGRNSKNSTHSGYSQAQYQSLAWLLARTGIPNDRITTHAAVDRSGTRGDPRSFDQYTLQSFLERYR